LEKFQNLSLTPIYSGINKSLAILEFFNALGSLFVLLHEVNFRKIRISFKAQTRLSWDKFFRLPLIVRVRSNLE
jgi:hypothetical protein